MITTTLNRTFCPGYLYRTHWESLLKGLGKTKADDEPFPFSRIVEIAGLQGALLFCRAEPQYAREWRLFAVGCARRVQHLLKHACSIEAIDVAKRYAYGDATYAELWAAHQEAWRANELYHDDWCAVQWATSPVTYAEKAEPLWRAVTWDPIYRTAQTQDFLRIVTETKERA